MNSSGSDAAAHPVGNDQAREADAPETELPEVLIKAEILPWRGRGNVIAAAGSFLVDLLERA